MQLTLASVALVNVAYLQPNVESKDEIELATEIVNVAKQSTKIFYNFYFGLIKKKRILLSVCVCAIKMDFFTGIGCDWECGIAFGGPAPPRKFCCGGGGPCGGAAAISFCVGGGAYQI